MRVDSSLNKGYDQSISFIRISAMIFIVICHLGSYFGSTTVSQFFNVGVHIFFLISGYLYGDRKIKEPVYWLFQRYIRLEIPASMWFLIIFVSKWIKSQPVPEIHEGVFILLNLQGLNFIFSSMKDLFIGPWFFTNIMGCYILMLCYLQIEKKHPGIAHVFDYGGVIPLFLFVLLGMIHISTDGALTFFIGFILKRRKYFEKPYKYNVIIAIACFAISVIGWLIGRRYLDGSVFYDEIIAPGAHVTIAVSFFIGIKWLFSVLPRLMSDITNTKLAKHLDKISIYIYISHDMLFAGPVLYILTWKYPLLLLLFIYIIAVVVFATLLYYLGTFITSQVNRLVEYLFL